MTTHNPPASSSANIALLTFSLAIFTLATLTASCSLLPGALQPAGSTVADRSGGPLPDSERAAARHIAAVTRSMNAQRIAAADSEPYNWLAHGRSNSEQRYSPLAQVNRDNVERLGLSWSYDTMTTHGLEASPIVIDGVMYTTGAWSVVYALDAATGRELWVYDPKVPRQWSRRGCCDVVNRGVAVWKGRVYLGTYDGRLVALDAVTGEVDWEVNTIDRSRPYTITGAPRVVKGRVIIGNGGAEFGVRGYISAYSARTGKLDWRFYTVPGDPSLPYEHPELETAAGTWDVAGKWWETGGGGTAWDSMAWDPELDLLYVGTGNGSPWNRAKRSPGGGDNLYLSSILALDPDTGRLAWHYQTTPGDTWDYTATQHLLLAELELDGRERKVIMQAPKNGFFYVLDRATGELLRADAYVETTWATHVDMVTGRPVEDPEFGFTDDWKLVKPAPTGGHNWQPMAFSPDTGLVYIPAIENPGLYLNEDEYRHSPGAWNLGMDLGRYAEILHEEGFTPVSSGYLKAWDPVAGRERWSVELPNFWNGGVLATAGGLVFQGTGDGRFAAYDAQAGHKLWEVPVMTGIIAPPVSYAVDGVQYVAVMAGWGGVGVPSGDARSSIVPEYGNDGRLLVFRLDGPGQVAIPARLDISIPEPPAMDYDQTDLALGSRLYMERCSFCHGPLGFSTGVVPDLRRMDASVHEMFGDVVLRGARLAGGMPTFADVLSETDVRAIHAYVIEQARTTR